MPGGKRKSRAVRRRDIIQARQCTKDMTFEECQMEVVRSAVEETNEKAVGLMNIDVLNSMTEIVEAFIIKKRLVCYGGTAINNILPRSAQFYNRAKDIPDYDFFSNNALDDSKELADEYHSRGFANVEAKAGVHHGTFKVFVNFVPMADVSQIHTELMERLRSDAITVRGIAYCPPDYLRMNMYLELSRPAGDVSRWEKVALRLMLLDRYFPLNPGGGCAASTAETKPDGLINFDKVTEIVKSTLIEEEAVFFGGFALDMYIRPDSKIVRKDTFRSGGFDVLHLSPEKCALVITEQLGSAGVKEVDTIIHEAIGEIVPSCYEVQVNKRPCVFIYLPEACRGYNTIPYGNDTIRIATIDTMMTFFLAFYYTNIDASFRHRVLCMAKQLFDISISRIYDTGIMKRYAVDCYGPRIGLNDIRVEKSKKFKDLKNRKIRGPEFDEWFLNYKPGEPKPVFDRTESFKYRRSNTRKWRKPFHRN